jgi:hypothetical protein
MEDEQPPKHWCLPGGTRAGCWGVGRGVWHSAEYGILQVDPELWSPTAKNRVDGIRVVSNSLGSTKVEEREVAPWLPLGLKTEPQSAQSGHHQSQRAWEFSHLSGPSAPNQTLLF